jgi:hypothetical protein
VTARRPSPVTTPFAEHALVARPAERTDPQGMVDGVQGMLGVSLPE